ncbi:proton-coupled zinc antiporter SLC30A1 [Brachyhypopomus gauderio]|uniref:proton-coupled zinc antiporter SLC30A1 n=1 Tax=Brachyhypopomus gauderio TaxID=698409 RepID=UPI00404293D6
MGRSTLWCTDAHRCVLAFTSALLLCEIVAGRVCKSLMLIVDSFHTLSILVCVVLHPSLIRTGASTSDPCTCPHPHERELQRIPSAAPVTLPCSGLVPSPQPAAGSVAAGAAPAVSEGVRHSALRLQPFGSLVSALLLAGMCISFVLEIISHTLQPRSISHPLLATVIGAVSLLFNGLMLVWRRGRESNVVTDGSNKSLTGIQHLNAEKKEAKFNSGSPESTFNGREETSGSMLMFCNPGLSSVVNQDQSSHAENSISHDSIGCQQSQQTLQPPGTLTEVANNNVCTGHTIHSRRPPTSGWSNQERRKTGQQRQDGIWGSITVIRSLLASVLVLINGLVPLALGPDCQPSQWGCLLLVYLDPGFSMLAVLVLLAGTLPEFRRYGLVLLQACPAHVHVQELTAHVARVPGVLAVHELHVWQLSETQLVASVHVHCLSGLGAPEYSGLLTAITEVLRGFGLSHCTVQLELLEHAASQSTNTAKVNTAEQPPCSLHCGKKCARMMCCSPPQERPCSTSPSSGGEALERCH